MSRNDRRASHSSSEEHPGAPPDHPVPQEHESGNRKISGPVGGSQGWGPESTMKKTRNRKPSSCVQCRRKKLRCDRGNPCAACIAKGEADQCSWENATPLFNSRDVHDAAELQAQVARLEDLVKVLTAQQDIDPSTHPVFKTRNSNQSSSGGDSPPLHQFQSFPSRIRQKSEELIDLRANDLCEALSQLAIREFVVLEGSGGDAWSPCGGGTESGKEFIDEARVFLQTMPQQFGLTFDLPALSGNTFSENSSDAGGDHALSPSPLGSAVFHRTAPPISELFQFLPTEREALSAYTYYSGYVSWYSHPVHLATFEAQWAQLKEALALDGPARDKAVDPFFVATFLGVLAMGLSMMPEKRALRDGFVGNKDRIVDHWLEGAMVSLTIGRFLDNPSVESIRAVVVISTYFVFMAPGESSGAGMGLLSLAVQVAMSLSLHRDPDKSPGKFTFFEAEERRRLFWNLFMLCILSSASLGRTWSSFAFDLHNSDCRFPLDCHDSEILNEHAAKAGIEARSRLGAETPMTSLIVKMKLAVMAKKINDRAFGIRPVSYSTVLDLDKELIEFEEAVPARYQIRLDSLGGVIRPTTHVTVTEMRSCMIAISVASEFIRIHRPWIVRAGKDPRYQYSRDQSIKYSKLLLGVYRTPSCNKQRWGGLTYKATTAATILAIEIIAFPDGSEVDVLRSSVKATAVQMESFISESSLCRKGSRLLRFLLSKEAEMVAMRGLQRAAKRSRQAAGSIVPLRAVFSTPYEDPRESVDEEDSYRHKASTSRNPSPDSHVDSSPTIHYASRIDPRPLPRSVSYRDDKSRNAFPPPNVNPSHTRRSYPPPSGSHSAPIPFTTLNGGEWPFDFTLPVANPYDAPLDAVSPPHPALLHTVSDPLPPQSAYYDPASFELSAQYDSTILDPIEMQLQRDLDQLVQNPVDYAEICSLLTPATSAGGSNGASPMNMYRSNGEVDYSQYF